jgi:hypothetical protein
LIKKNDTVVSLALSIISCCITKNVADNLGHFVVDVVTSPLSSDDTREKALLTLATIYSKTGVYCSVDAIIPKLTEFMQSSNMSLSSCACSVALAILRGGLFELPEELFNNTAIVASAVILESMVKKHYIVDDIPAPNTMMKFFQLLRYKKNWSETELIRMSDLLAKFIVMRKRKRDELGEAAFCMVFFEAVITLSKLPIQKKVAGKLTTILIRNIMNKNQSLYEFSLEGLNNLAIATQSNSNKIFKSRGALLKLIYSKKRPYDEMAFKVLFNASKGNEGIAENIILSTISYVPPYLMTKAQIYCAQIILRNPNLSEVVPRSVDMLLKGTEEFADKMWSNVALTIMKQENYLKQNMEACLITLTSNPHCNEGFVKLTAFLAGQYGYLCDCGGNAVIEKLVENFDFYSGNTQAIIITAMIKLSTRIPELRMPAINYLYDRLSSQNLEVVQRCREGDLLTTQDILLKKTLQTPKFTGITYSAVPTTHAFNPFGMPSSPPPVNQQTVPQQPPVSHIRKPSDGQWNSGLIDLSARKTSDHRFEIPVEEDEKNLAPLITIIDDSDDSENDEFNISMTASTVDSGFTDAKARKILEQFRQKNRGAIYEGEDYTILGMVSMRPPIASLVYKIQSFSSIPMSVDKFDIKPIDGLQFAFGDRPNVIDPNGYVIIRDNIRTTNVFTTMPIINVSVGGWSASAPVPILPCMWASPINVDQHTFVARWQAVAESSTKAECTNYPNLTDDSACASIKNAFNIDKLPWSPLGRPAFMGSFKTASENVGFLIIFVISGSTATPPVIEVRATNMEVTGPIVTLIQNEISFL